MNPGTTEYLVGTSDDVYRCAIMRRLEEDKAFDTAVIKELDMHYRDYVIQGARSSPVEVRLPTTGSSIADPGGVQPVQRRAKLNPGDFERHGYTVGCPGCEQLQLASPVRKNHTEACRKRMETELGKTSEGQERLGRAKDRLDIRVAEIGQAEIDKESGEQGNNQEPQQEDINENSIDPEGAGGVEPMVQGSPIPSTPR